MILDAEAINEALTIVLQLLGTAADLQQKVASGTITKADNAAAMGVFDTARNKLAADILAVDAQALGANAPAASPAAAAAAPTPATNQTPIGKPPTSV